MTEPIQLNMSKHVYKAKRKPLWDSIKWFFVMVASFALFLTFAYHSKGTRTDENVTSDIARVTR